MNDDDDVVIICRCYELLFMLLFMLLSLFLLLSFI